MRYGWGSTGRGQMGVACTHGEGRANTGVAWAWWVWPERVVYGRGLLLMHCPQELAAQQEEAELERGPAPPGPPNDYKDKYRHLIGSDAAKAAARTMEANKAYGCGEQGVLGRFRGVCDGPGGSWGSRRLGGVLGPFPGEFWAPKYLGSLWGAGESLRASQPPGSSLCPPVPVANKRDTRSIEEAMNEIRAKKRLRQAEDEGGAGGASV